MDFIIVTPAGDRFRQSWRVMRVEIGAVPALLMKNYGRSGSATRRHSPWR